MASNPCDDSRKGQKLPICSIVELYRFNCLELTRNVHVEFEKIEDFDEAVERAALALVGGKCHGHQRLVRKQSKQEMLNWLKSNLAVLRSCQSFDELFDLMQLQRIFGLGRLYLFDTAMRIGSHKDLNLRPKTVYLHSGTLIGANRLRPGFKAGRYTVEHFPTELRVLEPWVIEDLLCIYKDRL